MIIKMCVASQLDKKRTYIEKHLCPPALPICMTIGGDKRKMKKQIVAILAIIAVITALITVSAVSNEEGYNVTPCDAIDISLENTTVTDFLNATNMTTVQVYNFKGYKGENTWMVQWSSANRLLDLYVNTATGNIVGIEEKTAPTPTPTPAARRTWHSVITFSGSADKTTPPFTIKGDEWRVKYTVNSELENRDYSLFSGYVYPRGETAGYVSKWDCYKKSCSDTQYIDKGNDDYYIKVISCFNSWKLEVEDYY